MFEVLYNLRAEPFRLSPDHRFCYEHTGYAKARAYMAYAFMRAEGFVMITGRPGTGKTTLIGDLIESLGQDNVTTANLVCTQLQADDLLKTVAYSFGIDNGPADKAELLQQLNVLFHNWHRTGRRALLIVDEAQDLSTSAMEELRLLTNIQIDGQPLLQIFILGQPELRDLILSPKMEQVHQRIVAASHLEGLKCEETEAYIRHRLTAVGWQGDPAISRSIFPLVYKFSEGIPRRINLIFSRLMLHVGVEQRHEIRVSDIREVIRELQGENLAAGSSFSEDDFMVEDEFDPLPDVNSVTGGDSDNYSPSAQQGVESVSDAAATVEEPRLATAATEHRLHAVGDDVRTYPDSIPIVNPHLEQKKK
jgi:general secretion pathway protein A